MTHVDLADETSLIARVEDVQIGMSREERPDGLVVIGESMHAALHRR